MRGIDPHKAGHCRFRLLAGDCWWSSDNQVSGCFTPRTAGAPHGPSPSTASSARAGRSPTALARPPSGSSRLYEPRPADHLQRKWKNRVSTRSRALRDRGAGRDVQCDPSEIRCMINGLQSSRPKEDGDAASPPQPRRISRMSPGKRASTTPRQPAGASPGCNSPAHKIVHDAATYSARGPSPRTTPARTGTWTRTRPQLGALAPN